MIKAGSLLYAVYVCLLISVMSAALVFIFNYNLQLATRQTVQSDLIDLCGSCMEYYLADARHFADLYPEHIDPFDNGLRCRFTKNKWGLFTSLTVTAYFKKDTINKSTFVGPRKSDKELALVLCDWDEPLKVSGTTVINGSMQLPRSGYKKVNLLGNSQLNKPVILGSIGSSKQALPKLEVEGYTRVPEGKGTTLSKIDRKAAVFNDFNTDPLIIKLQKGEQLDRLSLKGNIIIEATDTLYINNTTRLTDVIVYAPKIVLMKNFKGGAQFFAEYEIEVEEAVVLEYPTALAIMANNNILKDKKITIAKNSKIYGSIVLDAATFDEKEANTVVIEEDASILGTVYCNGKLQLSGSVTGTVYAHKLSLETKSGTYANTLLNAKIDAVKVPSSFVHVPLFNSKAPNSIYGVVKTF